MLAEASEDSTRKFRFGGKLEGLELEELAARRRQPPLGFEALEARLTRDRDQQGDRTTAVGDLYRLASFDQAQVARRMLAQLTDPDPLHVLLVARPDRAPEHHRRLRALRERDGRCARIERRGRRSSDALGGKAVFQSRAPQMREERLSGLAEDPGERRTGNLDSGASPMSSQVHSILALILFLSAPPAAVTVAEPEESADGLTADEAAAFALAGDLDRRVHSDVDEDGVLWARGARWKMSFDGEVATYYPLLGVRQERHLPHVLSPASASIGSRPIPFAPSSPGRLANDRVEIDRGTFVEAYELTADSVEQLFVFERVPCGGDLVLRIETQSELTPSEHGDGLEFRGEHGGLTYSRAVAIDARNERVDAPTRISGGRIEIRVLADFLARAVAPLVIDPVIASFSVDTALFFADTRPDVAYDATTQRWLVIWERRAQGGGEADVAFRLIGDDGTTHVSGYVNLDNASWTLPRCANHNAYDNFLVVTSYYGSSGFRVLGRTLSAVDGSQGTVTAYSDPNGNDLGAVNPDVGGDPSNNAFAMYCVVYERIKSNGDSDINYRMVTGLGNPVGTYSTPLSPSVVSDDVMPSISKSNDSEEWGVVFDRDDAGSEQVLFARIDEVGNISGWPIPVMASVPDNSGPRVSTRLNGTPRYLIATNGWSGDIALCAMNGYTELLEANLSVLEIGAGGGLVQTEPCIDSDGVRFFIAYTETASNGDKNVLGTCLRLNASNSLIVRENRVPLGTASQAEFQPAIATKEGAGLAGSHRFLLPWSISLGFSSGNDIRAASYFAP